MTLPALVYSGLTKTGNEMHVFVHKWPGRMSAQRTLLSTGVTSFDYQLSCGQGDAYSCIEQLSILTSCGNAAVGSAAPLGIPANSPIYTAYRNYLEVLIAIQKAQVDPGLETVMEQEARKQLAMALAFQRWVSTSDATVQGRLLALLDAKISENILLSQVK